MEMGEDKEEATGFDGGTPSLSSSMLMMVVSRGTDAMTTLRFFMGAGFSLSSLFRFPFDGRLPGRMHIYDIRVKT